MKKAEIKILLFSLNEASTFSYNNIFVFLSGSVFLFCYCKLKVSLLHAVGPQYLWRSWFWVVQGLLFNQYLTVRPQFRALL